MKKLIAPAALALIATAAVAAPAAAQTFEGPYAGVEAGWSQNKLGRASTDIGRAAIDDSRDAFTTGVFAGYNYKLTDKVVVGGEAGFNLGFKDDVSSARGGSFASIDPETSFNLSARAGYLVNDQTLVYVRGGYENVRASVRINDTAGSRYSKDTFDGWSVGGGVERAITEKVSARVEYRYSDLGGGDTKFQRHQALVGVAYHF